MNCVYISYATFIAVLIYFVHYIQGRTALIFRTLCPWLYEVLAESSTLSVTKEFIHAVATMLGAHYVFNVAYASKTFGAMYYMQKYL